MAAEVFFDRLHQTFADKVDHLNALDAALGDGDHGSTMLRGLSAAVAANKGRRAKAFMRASGGASGTLFGLILVAIETHLERFTDQSYATNPGNDNDRRDDLLAGLAKALDRICNLGEVAVGDKSMVDALAPAVGALKSAGLSGAISAAVNGRDATVDMIARRGRAQYVENGGKGHVDPGAVSVVIFLETLQTVKVA